MPVDTMSGSVAAGKTANTAKAGSSRVPSSQVDPGKETEQEANTANDRRAYLEILRQSVENARETGMEIRVWESVSGETPVVVIAVYRTKVCGICGNIYPLGETCGICTEGAK